ncbi:MAG: alpha/beta hydrolase, partial [Neisseria sp.]|nr:alpha/beta hydrolase [Neisseria sp.]
MNNLSPNTPFWLRNGHADTIFAKFLQRPSPAYRRELLPDSTGKA